MKSIKHVDKGKMWEKVEEAWERERERGRIIEQEEEEEIEMVEEGERERIFEEVKYKNMRGTRVGRGDSSR